MKLNEQEIGSLLVVIFGTILLVWIVTTTQNLQAACNAKGGELIITRNNGHLCINPNAIIR